MERKIFWLILGALITALILMFVNNYWFKDNSSYIIRGSRIRGRTQIFSFGSPDKGWVALEDGLPKDKQGVFIALSEESKKEGNLLRKLIEKIDS